MAWAFVQPMWAHVKSWVTNKVTDAVTETLTETPMFQAGKRGVPIIAAYVAASALLLSHALLAGTQISFASYVLLSAAACVAILALLLLVCAPAVATEIPLIATLVYVPLLAVQCMLAAFATCIHQENRAGFAIACAVVLGLVVHTLVAGAFRMKFRQVRVRQDEVESADFETTQETEEEESSTGSR